MYLWVFIIFFVSLLVYNYSISTSNYFHLPREILLYKKKFLIQVLQDCEVKNLNEYLEAYDYFMRNPDKFDGATIVKDMPTIKGLDASAMVHDYQYLNNDFLSLKGFFRKFKYDFEYGKNQEKLRCHPVNSYFRSLLLMLSTPLYYLIVIFKRIWIK